MSGSNFIDYLKIHCRAGNGGAGSAHLRREKFVPRGGPDGGDGGRGGNIILRGNDQMWTLLHLRYRRHIFAGNGSGGGAQQSTGADGSDVVVEVPLGTIARNGDNGEFIFEITRHGDEKILAKGGRGGLGNTHFKSATNQTPRYAQPGESGEEGTFILELKVLADVGLVGFPNAGKSTLLSVVTAAKPKIADYPFTTLVPNLGIVSYRDDKSFVMADIPGIIEGAHEGRGLGIRFLRHVERNSILVIIIAADSPDIKNEYEVVLNELKMYNPELLDKKRILAVSKSDLLDAELKDEIAKDLPEIPGVFFSSVTGEGINTLKDFIWKTLTSY